MFAQWQIMLLHTLPMTLLHASTASKGLCALSIYFHLTCISLHGVLSQNFEHMVLRSFDAYNAASDRTGSFFLAIGSTLDFFLEKRYATDSRCSCLQLTDLCCFLVPSLQAPRTILSVCGMFFSLPSCYGFNPKCF